MSIEVRRASAEDMERWNRHVERSPHGTPFHLRESLSVLATHAGARLHPLIGFKGQEPVGVFPVFVRSRAGVTAAFSPPPDLLVPGLGPALLNTAKLKQRKAERRHRGFVEGCLEWLGDHADPRYVHVRTGGGYDDLRPLQWEGFDVTPGYTYEVDLTPGEDALLDAFSSDARSNVRDADERDCAIEEGGREDVRRIVRQVAERYAAQDESYGVTPSFVADLHEHTPAGVVRPYVCRTAGTGETDGDAAESEEPGASGASAEPGTFVGGMIALDDGHTVYRWQGGAKHDAEVPVNDLVDWRVMRDGIERGRAAYDLVGADTPRLNGYKAKFNPDLRTYYSAERSGPGMALAAAAYRRLR